MRRRGCLKSFVLGVWRRAAAPTKLRFGGTWRDGVPPTTHFRQDRRAVSVSMALFLIRTDDLPSRSMRQSDHAAIGYRPLRANRSVWTMPQSDPEAIGYRPLRAIPRYRAQFRSCAS